SAVELQQELLELDMAQKEYEAALESPTDQEAQRAAQTKVSQLQENVIQAEKDYATKKAELEKYAKVQYSTALYSAPLAPPVAPPIPARPIAPPLPPKGTRNSPVVPGSALMGG